jgi:prolipoprotein diacylglyceryltransferase
VLAIAYVGLYAVSQLILFEFRKSEPPGPLGLREAQWTSIATLVLGVPLLYLLWRRTNARFEKRSPDGPSAAEEPATAR